MELTPDMEQDISEFVREEAMAMIQAITVVALEWLDKVNGNTYHSARAIVRYVNDPDGEHDHTVYVPFGYGGDRQYLTSVQDELEDNDILWRKAAADSGYVTLRRQCDQLGVQLIEQVGSLMDREIVERWGKEAT